MFWMISRSPISLASSAFERLSCLSQSGSSRLDLYALLSLFLRALVSSEGSVVKPESWRRCELNVKTANEVPGRIVPMN